MRMKAVGLFLLLLLSFSSGDPIESWGEDWKIMNVVSMFAMGVPVVGGVLSTLVTKLWPFGGTPADLSKLMLDEALAHVTLDETIDTVCFFFFF